MKMVRVLYSNVKEKITTKIKYFRQMENNLTNLINDVLNIFKSGEFSDIFNDYLNFDNECKKNKEKDKDYYHYDKKTYINDKLVDHIEKKYEDGKCCYSKHDPNNRISGGLKEETPKCEHKCGCDCENKCINAKDYKEENIRLKKRIKELQDEKDALVKTMKDMHNTGDELIATLKTYVNENKELQEKLNNIKKMF